MKNSINYLKFDYKIAKKSIKYYVLIQSIICCSFIFLGNYVFGMSYLFFFLIILATIPFSMQGNEKSTEMYYMLPAKTSSMVLGRFLYLICTSLVIFILSGAIILILYGVNKIESLESITICLNGIISLIICLIQYPICYKFGLEKGKILSTVIYIISAMVIFILPQGNQYIYEKLQKNLYLSNNIVLILFSLLIVTFIGYISYLISCRICKKKEV